MAQAARRVDQRIEYGKRIHVGAQAFHVDTDDKIRCPLPGAPDPGGGEHMGMRMNRGRLSPACSNGAGGARSQRDQSVRGGYQDV